MQLDIQSRGFSLTTGISNYAKQRMQFAMCRNDRYVIRARMRLEDINGPRGGIDKKCLIELRLAGQANIVIEDTEADLYLAIDRASDRCMRTLTRRLERSRQYPHEMLSVQQATDS